MKNLFKITILAFLLLAAAGCAGTSKGRLEQVMENPVAASGKTDIETAAPDSDEASTVEEALPSFGASVDDAVSESPAPVVRSREAEAKTEEMSFLEDESDMPVESEGAKDLSGRSPSGVSPEPGRSSGSVPSESGLKAGFADDNKQYGYFIDFLKEYDYALHLPLPVNERIRVYVKDINNKSVPNADIRIYNGEELLCSGKTTADGSYQFNPDQFSASIKSYTAEITASGMQMERTLNFERSGKRTLDASFGAPRITENRVPLDILFVLDTTGSMGEEIRRLKTTIELIHLNLSSLSARPLIRFGLVLYKDVGDEYLTEIVPLTENLEGFQQELQRVEAGGGGDTPEDLQAALDDSLNRINWNKDGIRLSFIITDAPPHLDYNQEFTYTDAAKSAREKGIKFFTVGTGGLDIDGEYVLRQISQYTSGKYIFLTYGEGGESSGGTPGSVSHHTGSNFQTDKLEAIIIRFAKEELSFLSDKPIEDEDPYFQAVMTDSEEREETLTKLFNMALSELQDYSTYSVSGETAAAVLPIEDPSGKNSLNAEYFTERFILAAAGNAVFKLVERKDFQKILEEMNLQLSGLTEEENVTEVGNFLNAEVLIAGKMYRKDSEYELFLKLLRVETGEVLSITRAKIDYRLGLSGE